MMTLTRGSAPALIIKAKGGLGNRMLSGVTGLLLASLQGREPYIDWRDGMYVPRGENLYPLLFDARWMGALAAFDDCDDVAPGIWSARMRQHPTDLIHDKFPNAHQDPLIYRKLSVDLIGESPPQPVAVFWSYISKLKRLKSRLKGVPEFADKSEDQISRDILARFFKPVPEVLSIVDAALPIDGRRTIGVHIRFTDRKAPLDKIIKALQTLHDKHPEARVFLATDSLDAQRAVLAHFPAAIQIAKTLADDGAALHVASGLYQDPLAEARSALADMIALSRCDHLVHSSHSTFSVTSALIGGMSSTDQIDVDRNNLQVAAKKFIQARI